MPNNDSPLTPAEKSGDVWLGGVLVGLSLVVFALSRSIKSLGLGDNFDPGSKAFPLGLAAILGVGGLIEIWHSRRASVVVTDETPVSFLPRMVAKARARLWSTTT